VGNGFVGLVDTTQESGDVVIQVVNEDGTARFGVQVPPICSAFVVVRNGARQLLVTMSTTLGAKTAAGGAVRFFATARDLSSGARIWGPVQVSGAWRGPGLVYGNQPTSQVGASAKNSPSSVIRASDGATVLVSDAGNATALRGFGVSGGVPTGRRRVGRGHSNGAAAGTWSPPEQSGPPTSSQQQARSPC